MESKQLRGMTFQKSHQDKLLSIVATRGSTEISGLFSMIRDSDVTSYLLTESTSKSSLLP